MLERASIRAGSARWTDAPRALSGRNPAAPGMRICPRPLPGPETADFGR
jgi:hypothetical protein